MMDYSKVLNRRIQAVPPSGIRKFFDLLEEMPDAISLGIGEPDFITPWHIRDAGIYSLERGHTKYTSNAGMLQLRREISGYLNRRFDLKYSYADQILVTVGGSEAIDLAMRVLLNPGDEVIVPVPSFVCYGPLAEMAGGVPVYVELKAEDEFRLTPEQLKAAITPKTKAIILTSPNNPTGCIYKKENLDAIHEVLKDLPIFVICDDVYRTLTYTGEYHSFSEYQDMRDRIIVIQSFSKPYAMTGWRLGYCLADAPIRDRMQIFHQYCVVSVPSFVQPACVAALESDTSGVVEIFRKRKEYVYKRLIDMGLEVQEPEGAFYMFINIEKYGMDSLTFCEKMLKEGLVGLIPGIYFGTEGYARLSYCYSDEDLKEGLDRIENFIKTL